MSLRMNVSKDHMGATALPTELVNLVMLNKLISRKTLTQNIAPLVVLMQLQLTGWESLTSITLGLWLTKQNSVRRLRVVLYQRMVIL
jgi:hypothetical protein